MTRPRQETSPCLPSRFAAVILAFAPLFFQRSWRHAEVLLTGAILAPGKRTVTSLLHIVGLAHERRFVNGVVRSPPFLGYTRRTETAGP